MDFILVFKFILETFKREKIDFALIGGFALQAAGITRTTGDIDMLVLKEDKEKIKDVMIKHRYKLLHESDDTLNFYSDKFELGRIDFLLAYRKYALSMLKRAEEKDIFKGKFKIKVIKVEDQIGLKVQSISNDSSRMSRDMADIEQLIRYNYPRLDTGLVREYFKLFDREAELDEIIKRVENA